VQFCDGNTFNYGYVGSRATGNEAGDYLLVGPDWNGTPPPAIKKVFHATTQFSLVLFRTQLFGPDDMPKVEKVQAGYKAQPLSAYLHQPAPPAAPAINFLPINKDMVKTNFFQYLDFALQFAPAGPEEQAIRAQLARIGIGAGKKFNFDALDLEHKLEVGLGMKAGESKIEENIANAGKNINGWRVAAVFGDRHYFNGNWLLRAAAAKAGIYGNDAAEAMYPMSRWDVTGATLDGSRHNYTLTFPAGQLPPVNAFWSVTMYDGKTQLLVENPITATSSTRRCCRALRRTPTARSRFTFSKIHPVRTRKATGCPRRTARSTWSCASIGQKQSRLQSCHRVKEHGNRRA
jgi:hypothetical protein